MVNEKAMVLRWLTQGMMNANCIKVQIISLPKISSTRQLNLTEVSLCFSVDIACVVAQAWPYSVARGGILTAKL